MTALATIAALLPLAAGLSGEGGIISRSLGAVVIGGLLTATLLTLVIVPAVFSTFEGLAGVLRRLLGRRGEPILAGAPPGPSVSTSDGPAPGGSPPAVSAGAPGEASDSARAGGRLERPHDRPET
jgi:hypothetical protein